MCWTRAYNLETIEYLKEVSIGEDAKLCGEHKENKSRSEERPSVEDIVEITWMLV
jgi:hypothetical protein